MIRAKRRRKSAPDRGSVRTLIELPRWHRLASAAVEALGPGQLRGMRDFMREGKVEGAICSLTIHAKKCSCWDLPLDEEGRDVCDCLPCTLVTGPTA